METNVDLKMWNIKERNKTVDLVQEFYNYVEEKYRDYVYIYTDGSKEQVAGATAAAMVVLIYNSTISRRTSDHLSVYAVEFCAILLAIEWMESVRDRKTVICSNSFSSLKY